MKNLFKLTDAKIIISLFVLGIGLLAGVAALNPAKAGQKQSKNFVGIDAAGYAHYPNGNTEFTGKF
jgi:hypothetical protein